MSPETTASGDAHRTGDGPDGDGILDHTTAGLAEDRQARRLAQSEFERPLLLEAGAGTGKTTTLVARVLAWCLGPGWRRHADRLAAQARDRALQGGRATPPAADEIGSEVLERVVAITFTEDAAAEMARRVAEELGRLADPATSPPPWLHLDADDAGLPPAERARRAAALLATLDRLVVRTIHAFCRGLLADHPLEAGLHPDLAVDADGLLLEEVARETVESNLRRLYGDAGGSGPHLALAARGIGPRELVEALVVLSQAGLPADALDLDPLAPAEVARLSRRLEAACRRVQELVEPCLGDVGRAQNAPKLCSALAAARNRLQEAAAAEGDGVARLRAVVGLTADLFPGNLRSHLDKWRTWKMGKAEKAGLAAVRDDLSAAAAELGGLLAHLERLDPELLDLAHRALAPLHRQVREELRARGVVTFEDLLAQAARLLEERPDVATGVRLRIDQLLVDEFQDTDALQCEIVAALGLVGEKRPGLFLVGDPKQSIYGWRSADLAAYDAFRRRVLAAGGEVLPLVQNFRSVPAILEEVERAVAPVMLEAEGYQPPFQPLLACERLAENPGFLTPGPDGDATDAAAVRRAAVEHWVPWHPGGGDGEPGGPDTAKGRSYEVEADAVARDVRHLHDAHGVGWDRVAVLLRSTTDLDLYLEALRRHGVPFAVGRDKQYYRRREVIDAAALVRCVLDPGDHLALLTVLRSPWVGVPDAALVPLWNRGFPDLLHRLTTPDPRHLAAAREVAEGTAAELADLPPGAVPGLERVAGWEISLAAAVEQLALARQAFRELPADVFVDTLRRLFLPEPVAAARYLGAYRLANLERFFRRLVTALEDGGGDVTAVLRALRRSVAEAREAPEGKPREGAEDAVQVMTIHQAKGLDFSHVYLPQLHKGSKDGGPDTDVQPALDPLAALDPPAARRAGEGGGDGGELRSRFEMKLFGTPSLGYDRVEAKRARVEAAERVRLLYVAMTRAEQRLVLSAAWGGEAPRPKGVERARSFLDLLAHRPDLPPSLGERWEEDVADLEDDAGVLWRFAGRTPWPEGGAPAIEDAVAPDPIQVAADSRRLEQRVRRAAVHRQRPFGAAASAEAHHLLGELMQEEMAAAGGPPGHGAARLVALAVGDAVHRVLEEVDLEALGTHAGKPPSSSSNLRVEDLDALVRAVAEPGLDAAALEAVADETRSLLDRLAGGRLLARLAEVAPHVLGREVPVLLAPPRLEPREAEEIAAAPSVPLPPVGYYAGAVDLLYSDPETGEIVVADYKTDDVDGDRLDARVLRYASQGRIYADAVQQALGLNAPPRFELWFLRTDQVVPVELEAPLRAPKGRRPKSGSPATVDSATRKDPADDPSGEPPPIPRPSADPAPASSARLPTPDGPEPDPVPSQEQDSVQDPERDHNSEPDSHQEPVAEDQDGGAPRPAEQISLFDLE